MQNGFHPLSALVCTAGITAQFLAFCVTLLCSIPAHFCFPFYLDSLSLVTACLNSIFVTYVRQNSTGTLVLYFMWFLIFISHLFWVFSCADGPCCFCSLASQVLSRTIFVGTPMFWCTVQIAFYSNSTFPQGGVLQQYGEIEMSQNVSEWDYWRLYALFPRIMYFRWNWKKEEL